VGEEFGEVEVRGEIGSMAIGGNIAFKHGSKS
jgi:hypothetical protein